MNLSERQKTLLLFVVSLLIVPVCLEVYLRIFPPEDFQTNNEYQYRDRTGKKKFLIPHHSWEEKFPPDFDERGYYEEKNYTVEYHFNQFGARWIDPGVQPVRGKVFLVLGDSFTYGSGVRYEDTYIFKTQGLLADGGATASLLNFAKSGADVQIGLEIYRSIETLPHDGILYGLHLNDLISFPTSFVSSNQALGLPLIEHSKFIEFVLNKINASIGRFIKIEYLTSPRLLEKDKFKRNMNAIFELKETADKRGLDLHVAVLPILIDVDRGTFEPVYREIRDRLRERGVKYTDLTGLFEGYNDSDLWIIPVDQHPNEIANDHFAATLARNLADYFAEPAN